jgi:hypothetical protein
VCPQLRNELLLFCTSVSPGITLAMGERVKQYHMSYKNFMLVHFLYQFRENCVYQTCNICVFNHQYNLYYPLILRYECNFVGTDS